MNRKDVVRYLADLREEGRLDPLLLEVEQECARRQVQVANLKQILTGVMTQPVAQQGDKA